jgi:hypothetical protein
MDSLTLKTFIMKKITLVSVVIAFFLMTGITNAQNIAISDASHTADASAVLDVYSTSLGMLVPRLSSTPSTPANGLLYYSTTSNSFFYNAGTSGSPSWTELSYGNLWTRSGTDTYLSNMTDNLVIGTNSSSPGYKFFVYGATSQMSRFDGQIEVWNHSGAGTVMDADINDDGMGNGIISIYSGSSQTVQLSGLGNSFFNGGNVGIGGNPLNLLHLMDNIGTGLPQLQIDNLTGSGNTSIGFFNGTGMPPSAYTEGIEGNSGDFVLQNTGSITAATQSDGATMFRAFPSGIIDLNNQSRSRVFQADGGQSIPTNTWQPIDFNSSNYDQQTEWTLGAGSPPGGPPVSFFVAKEEGYYQVNARTAYFLGDPGDNWWVNYDAFVSIAIYKGNAQGNWNMYAQGNNLQIGQIWNPQGPMEEGLSFKHNNAPNVSDVVYLQKGEMIAIYAWQSSGINLNLVPGTMKTYCSIHKSS